MRKGFAYTYAAVLISVVVASVTLLLVFYSSYGTKSVLQAKQVDIQDLASLSTVLDKAEGMAINASAWNLLAGYIYSYIRVYNTTPPTNSYIGEIDQHLNSSLAKAMNDFMNAVSIYGVSRMYTMVDLYTVDRFDIVVDEGVSNLGGIRFYYATCPTNLTVEYIVNPIEDPEAKLTIVRELSSTANVGMRVGSLSVYDVSYEVNLKITREMGSKRVPILVERVYAVKKNAGGYENVSVGPVTVDPEEGTVSFIVGASLKEEHLIIIEVDLYTGEKVFVMIYYPGAQT